MLILAKTQVQEQRMPGCVSAVAVADVAAAQNAETSGRGGRTFAPGLWAVADLPGVYRQCDDLRRLFSQLLRLAHRVAVHPWRHGLQPE